MAPGTQPRGSPSRERWAWRLVLAIVSVGVAIPCIVIPHRQLPIFDDAGNKQFTEIWEIGELPLVRVHAYIVFGMLLFVSESSGVWADHRSAQSRVEIFAEQFKSQEEWQPPGGIPDGAILDAITARSERFRYALTREHALQYFPAYVQSWGSSTWRGNGLLRRGALFGSPACAIPLQVLGVGSCVGLLPFALTVLRVGRRRRRKAQQRCVSCGYLLRGLVDKRCPECGAPF